MCEECDLRLSDDTRFMAAIDELVGVCRGSDVPLPWEIEAALPFGIAGLRAAARAWMMGFQPDTRATLLRRFPGLVY
jgi:hypothetical protein